MKSQYHYNSFLIDSYIQYNAIKIPAGLLNGN